MNDLHLHAYDGNNDIHFSDERARSGKGGPEEAVASITFSNEDNSWGEFLNSRQLLSIKAWVDTLVIAVLVEEEIDG